MTDPFANGYWVKADYARDLERRLAAATARAERFEYCEECNFPLSDCGELNPDGTPSVDCRVCQLVSKLTDLRAELDRLRKEREWQPIVGGPSTGGANTEQQRP